MNQNWPRWIKASIYKHFENILTGHYIILEGCTDRRDQEPLTRFEIRVDGPDVDIKTATEYKLSVYINLLVQTELSELDIYLHERHLGLGASCFGRSILVEKHGDDLSQLGCLEQISEIVTTRFDTIKPLNVQCSTVEAEYRITLMEEA